MIILPVLQPCIIESYPCHYDAGYSYYANHISSFPFTYDLCGMPQVPAIGSDDMFKPQFRFSGMPYNSEYERKNWSAKNMPKGIAFEDSAYKSDAYPCSSSLFPHDPCVVPDTASSRSNNLFQSQYFGSRFFEMPYNNSECNNGRRRDMSLPRYNQKTVRILESLRTAKRSNIIYLPLDIIFEILRRLAPKDILRSKRVCKSWNSLIREHHLINELLQNDLDNSGLRPAVLYQSEDDPTLTKEVLLVYFVKGFHRFNMTHLYNSDRELLRMSNCCNGLACVYGEQNVCVVNPNIGEVVDLPKGYKARQVSVALTQDALTREYKVVRVFERAIGVTGCEIYEFGSSCWRRAQDAPLPISYHHLPVIVNGAVHWSAGFRVKKAIAVSFDVKNEKFDVIRRPIRSERADEMFLFELDGCLCLTLSLSRGKDVADLKFLKYEGKHVWKEDCIRREGHESICYTMPSVPVPSDKVTILYEKVFWQDAYTGFIFQDLISSKYSFSEQASPYKGSLVSPVSIQEKNTRRKFCRSIITS